MREILFRGKRIVNGKWIEGYIFTQRNIVEHRDDYYIRNYNTDYLVDPETVGQYTGLTDKNGVKIFEGDIVIFNRKRNLPNYESIPEVIIYHQGDCAFQRYPYGQSITKGGAGKLIQQDMMAECEVIGNIHDNPELLEGGGDNA